MKKKTLPALFLAAALLPALAGCGKPSAPPPPDPVQTGMEVHPPESPERVEHFAVITAAELLSGEENFCYSPISLYLALSMAATGAAGETQGQMYAVLGASDTETLSNDCAALYANLYRDGEDTKLYLANSVWTAQGVLPKEEYVRRLEEKFSAEAFSVDFSDGKTNQRMTDWVKERTQGLLAPEFQTSSQTVEVLLNTIYYKNAWYEPFYEGATETGDFTVSGGGTVQAPFMRTFTRDEAWTAEGYARASLPFADGGEMFFVLPDADTSLADLLRSHGLQDLISGGERGRYAITWRLPKFRQSSDMDLIPMLQRLGITDAFDGTADFSNASDADAYISAVRQGTCIDVNEMGVEAAAYTVITKDEAAPLEEELPELSMELDRPFLYGIRSNDGTLLFVGVCADPAAGQEG